MLGARVAAVVLCGLAHAPTTAFQLVHASFLGVGAPEAFVIAIVSLLVFGPKGLAEVRQRKRLVPVCVVGSTDWCTVDVGGLQIAKNLGQTLRAFQPTIRELQQVSQDFKSALDQEVCCFAAGKLRLALTHALHFRSGLMTSRPRPPRRRDRTWIASSRKRCAAPRRPPPGATRRRTMFRLCSGRTLMRRCKRRSRLPRPRRRCRLRRRCLRQGSCRTCPSSGIPSDVFISPNCPLWTVSVALTAATMRGTIRPRRVEWCPHR